MGGELLEIALPAFLSGFGKDAFSGLNPSWSDSVS